MLPITSPPIENGLVVVDEGKIIDIGPQSLLSQYPNAEVEEYPHSVLMPGLVNAHTHLSLINFDSTSLDFYDRLTAGWEYRKKQTLSDGRHSLEDGIRQLLLSGTTCVGDAGQYVGLIPQALNSQMRMVLFPEILSGGETPAVQEAYESAFAQVEEIQGTRSGRITAGIAPYAAYTLSRHLLKVIAQQAQHMRMPVQIHVSETFSEMQFFYESTGEIAEKLFPKIGWEGKMPPAHRRTPVQYLESIGFLETAPALIGCNHLADPDLQILAKTGSKVVHSPRANARLRLGTPPLAKLRQAGVTVGLGTNGPLHSLSLWDEMRAIQDHYPDADRPPADTLLQMATLNGAKALGLEEKIGSLEAGKEADLIAVRVPKESSLKEFPSWLVSNATDREIEAVFIQGKRIKA